MKQKHISEVEPDSSFGIIKNHHSVSQITNKSPKMRQRKEIINSGLIKQIYERENTRMRRMQE